MAGRQACEEAISLRYAKIPRPEIKGTHLFSWRQPRDASIEHIARWRLREEARHDRLS